MNISKKDFALLTGMVEFHFKFAEYVRENIDKDLFFRAIDYAKTYAKVDGMEFNYWHEDNKKFLVELLTLLRKRINTFNRLTDKYGKNEAESMFIRKKKTSKEDPLGFNSYLSNFIHHAKELDYDAFDMEDWVNFAEICKYIKNEEQFLSMVKKQVERILGTDNDIYRSIGNEQS